MVFNSEVNYSGMDGIHVFRGTPKCVECFYASDSNQSNQMHRSMSALPQKQNGTKSTVYVFDVYICEIVTLFASCACVCLGKLWGPDWGTVEGDDNSKFIYYKIMQFVARIQQDVKKLIYNFQCKRANLDKGSGWS